MAKEVADATVGMSDIDDTFVSLIMFQSKRLRSSSQGILTTSMVGSLQSYYNNYTTMIK